MNGIRVGIDLLEVNRMEKMYNNRDNASKIFTDYELNHIDKLADGRSRMAGIYCAKEAFLKALGVGVRNGICFQEVEINHEENGRPYYVFNDHVKDIMLSLNIKKTDLSISHSDNFATAICIME